MNCKDFIKPDRQKITLAIILIFIFAILAFCVYSAFKKCESTIEIQGMSSPNCGDLKDMISKYKPLVLFMIPAVISGSIVLFFVKFMGSPQDTFGIFLILTSMFSIVLYYFTSCGIMWLWRKKKK